MRTIKFRAWNKKQNCWANINQLSDWGSAEITACIGMGNKEYPYETFRIESDNIYEIMQYTGLKDWHKKEIYEGDIVRFTEKDGLVEYMDEVIEDMHTIYDHCWKKNVDYSDIRVIGNIYEDPELL